MILVSHNRADINRVLLPGEGQDAGLIVWACPGAAKPAGVTLLEKDHVRIRITLWDRKGNWPDKRRRFPIRQIAIDEFEPRLRGVELDGCRGLRRHQSDQACLLRRFA